jgi:hypothetical protein
LVDSKDTWIKYKIPWNVDSSTSGPKILQEAEKAMIGEVLAGGISVLMCFVGASRIQGSGWHQKKVDAILPVE